jgi:hypothetical protein
MDRTHLDPDTERLVQEVMDREGCDLEEAILAVAIERGEVYGDGDLVSINRLTPEQRRLSGLEHDPDQVMAETRARMAARALAGGKVPRQ